MARSLSAGVWQALGNSSLHCLGQSAYLSVLRIPQPAVTKEHQVRFSFQEHLIMNPRELPEPIFDNGEELTPEIEMPTQPEPVYNALFENLVPQEPETRVAGRLSFAHAMPRMGMSSVFDIIRQPKNEFTRQLRTLSDADGDMAYDNAMCYATQIARSYREEVVSSGRSLPEIAPQTGVRALVDVGPSYPNLFKENWDQFCKVGAIEAMDGPVAYLASLRRFAEQRIEEASTSPKRIPLAVRRPDLDTLLIDEQSTYQSRPMLDLVNDVLTQGIDKYQKEKGDERPIHQLLAEKKHPFVFPYHFAHQQVSLALANDTPSLGELNYRLRMAPANAPALSGGLEANRPLQQLSDVNPKLQQLLTAPPLFPTFYFNLKDYSDPQAQHWTSPSLSELYVWQGHSVWLQLPEQTALISCEPPITSSQTAVENTETLITVRLSNGQNHQDVKVRAYTYFHQRQDAYKCAIHMQVTTTSFAPRCLGLYLDPRDNAGLDIGNDYAAQLLIDVHIGPERIVQRLRMKLHGSASSGDGWLFTTDETCYWQDHMGTAETTSAAMSLTHLNTFMDRTGLAADAVEQALAINRAAPQVSANCPRNHPHLRLHNPDIPSGMQAGACYVNGSGGWGTHLIGEEDIHHNAMRISNDAGNRVLLNGTPDRLDRLQRMVRLQKALGIEFPQLDNLIVAGMRSEGAANRELHINQNTLRLLGTYRYLHRNHGLMAEELAAFVGDINPYSFDERLPMFDRVFNSPVLFGTPLQLDNQPFTLTSRPTINQLCAGLGMEPDSEAFTLAVQAILDHVGSLACSLPIVSAFYRQARIGNLFGLNVADLHYLLRLLGGDAYVGKCTAGVVLPRLIDTESEPDILDILMQLDQTVRWLKTHKLTVPGLRALLDAPATTSPTTALLERLEQLAGDAHAERITENQIDLLKLPELASGTRVEWYNQLRGWTLVSPTGFVIIGELTAQNTDEAQLRAKVREMIASLGLAVEDIEPTILRLGDWLLDRLTRQQRLSEGFLQEQSGLLPELASLVGDWAAISSQALLYQVTQAWPAEGEPAQNHIDYILGRLHTLGTVSQLLNWSPAGPRALRTFLANPQWLGTASIRQLTLSNLYLLKAYDTLFNTLGQPEERLLDYLELANTAVSKRPGKRQLAVQAHTCNAALATLLGWSESEIAVLTARLPQQTAKTVAHIDWLRRAQTLAMETGLNAATLLQACALNADSPDADWQAVGQAAMAAVRA